MTPQEEQERYLIEIIELIKSDYMKAAEPYMKRLANLRAMSLGIELPVMKK